MIDHFVHEITVVRNNDQTTFEVAQVIFQDTHYEDVEVVGWLIENQEIRICHQNGHQFQAAFFASAQFVHVVVMHVAREEETFQKLRCG